jgi:hypothetical protein
MNKAKLNFVIDALMFLPFLISPEVKDVDAGQERRSGAQGEIGPAGSGAEPHSLTRSR